MSSSIAFFLGKTNAVRALCNEPIKHCMMCNTSSDDLWKKHLFNYIYTFTLSPTYSTE